MRKLIIAAIVVGVVIVGMAVYLVWLMCTDAPAIPNDYAMADLRSSSKECQVSYNVLLKLAGMESVGAVNIGDALLDDGDTSNDAKVIAMAGEIESAWERGQTGRQLLAELDKFTEIADLTKPRPMATDVHVAESSLAIIDLGSLYHAHVMLQLARGNQEAAARELIEFDSVLRKLVANLRTMMAKSVFNELLQEDMTLAASMANRQGLSRGTVELLARHFVPLSEEQTSWRNCIVFASLADSPLTDKEVEQRKTDQTRVMMSDDLLQIVLSRRLGKAYNLKARAYSAEYVIDANGGRIVSPGPDMKMCTRDDIWLPIDTSGFGEGPR